MSITKVQQAHFQGQVRSRKEKEGNKRKETHNMERKKCQTGMLISENTVQTIFNSTVILKEKNSNFQNKVEEQEVRKSTNITNFSSKIFQL